MNTRITKFVEERNETLFSLDKKRIEAYLKKQGCDVPENDIVFWAGIYKSICNISGAPEALVQKAKRWLFSHGMSEYVTINKKTKYGDTTVRLRWNRLRKSLSGQLL